MNSQMHASRSIILGAINTIHKTRAQRIIIGAIKTRRKIQPQGVNGKVDDFFLLDFIKQKIITPINSN